MNECNSIEGINAYFSLSDQIIFRLNEINKIKDYFNWEIQESKIMSNNLSKCIAAFDYFDKTLIVLSATTGVVSSITFASVIWVPEEIASATFTLVFSLTTGIIKKVLEITRNKKNKCNKILMLAKSKLNSIETLISQALIDLEISHEELKIIVNETEKFERMKEIIIMMESSDELSGKNKSITVNRGNA